jgi:N-acetylglucosaminylphosphatidylinositol deacetylase
MATSKIDNTDTATSTLHIFITAHPDDEAMFFIPTILSIPNPKWILCLSNGNYDGLGKQREIELNRACGLLGFDKVTCLDHPSLPDGPQGLWLKDDINKVLKEHVPKDRRHVHIITFDEGGVSGHINHRDTYNGVRHFINEQKLLGTGTVQGWALETITNPISKYLPMYHWCMLAWTWFMKIPYRTAALPLLESSHVESTSYRPVLNWKCMSAHETQFVWYRRLFVVFSIYTYYNRIKGIRRD